MTDTRVPKRTLRAWLYLRISDDKTGEEKGVERQEFEMRLLCEHRGWTVADRTVDNSVSATTGRRKSFDDLLELVCSRTIDVLIGWHIDRLVRDNREMEELIEACERHGVMIVTMTGDLDMTTDSGRLVARILVSVARGEIERKRARHKSAFEQALRDGVPFGGSPRAFGYKAGGLELLESEAAVLGEMYAMWTGGASLGEIARKVNTAGVRTPKGHEWTTGTLREVLRNPRNAGLRGTKPMLFDADGRPVLDAKGRQRRSQWHDVIGPAAWPAIPNVDESVWRATIARLKDPARREHYSGHARKHLSAALFKCSTCGKNMKTQRNNQQRSMRCQTRKHCTRKAEPVERFVVDTVLERLRQADAIDLLQAPREELDLGALRDERDAIQQRMRDMARDEVLGRRTRDEVLAAREAADERLKEIEAQIEDAGRVDVVAKFLAADDPADVWYDEATTLRIQQALIDALCVVRVGSGKIGRPQKYDEDHPPHNVIIEWRR